MADLRPSLDVIASALEAESAVVTIPGFAPVTTVWIEQRPVLNQAEGGTYALAQSRRRGSLRLDQLPAASRPGLSWPPRDTTIVIGSKTLHVEEVDYQDDQVSHVIVR